MFYINYLRYFVNKKYHNPFFGLLPNNNYTIYNFRYISFFILTISKATKKGSSLIDHPFFHTTMYGESLVFIFFLAKLFVSITSKRFTKIALALCCRYHSSYSYFIGSIIFNFAVFKAGNTEAITVSIMAPMR